MSKEQAFPKVEHLRLRREVEALFSSGSRSLSAYPVRAVFHLVEQQDAPQAKVLLSVAKRRLRRAVDRNRAKRQLREAYRLNKPILLPHVPAGRCLHLGFIWLSDAPIESARVQRSVRRALQQVAERLQRDVASGATLGAPDA